MAKTQPPRAQLSSGEALYVLDRLVTDKRVTAGEVARLAAEMHEEIADLERRLSALRQAAESVRTGTRQSGPGRQGSGRAKTVAPALMRSRKLQGQYMGLIRHIPASARPRMKKLAGEQGREAAVNAMRALLSK
jgi:hypothetical protein